MRLGSALLLGASILCATACAADDDSGALTDEEYLAAFEDSPYASVDDAALIQAGEELCAQTETASDMFVLIQTFEDEGFTSDQAIRAGSAVVARFCPEILPED